MSHRLEEGSALPIVLWVMAVLLIISLSFSLVIQSRVRRMEMLFNRFQASLEASSSVQYGLNILLTGSRKPTEILTSDLAFFPDGNRYFLDGTPVAVPFFENKPLLSFQDYAGLINLRSYNPELIDGLMRYFGAAEDNRKFFVDSLLDWIDPDDLTRLNGAEKDYYEPLGYRPRNAPLLTLDEILLIRGMEESLYSKIQPFLILSYYAGGVNPNTAPFEVLMSFPHMTEEAARAILAQRKFGYILSIDAFSAISKINYSFYERLFNVTPSPSLIIQASSPFGDGSTRYVILCHVKRKYGPGGGLVEEAVNIPVEEPGRWTPYDILLWKEQVR